MDRLSGLMPFVRSAELGIRRSGRDLGLSPSAVGKAVAKLEKELHVRLFQRSTRRMQLTEEGRIFHERCRRILEDLDDAHAMLAQTLEVPRGRLRVSTPTVSYHLLPALRAFAARYPEIELDIDFNDRLVDLIGERVDVAIRSGNLPDSRLMARPVGRYRMMLCASPEYLARYGIPACVRDLDQHLGVRFRFTDTGVLQDWPLPKGADEPDFKVRTVLTCNNMEALLGATIKGFGIGWMPDFLVDDAIANGALQAVLVEAVQTQGQFQAIWPSSRNLSPKVRVFVDFMAQRLFK